METPADVGHSHPFLYDRYSSDHIFAAQDLCGNKVAYLVEKGRQMDGWPAVVKSNGSTQRNLHHWSASLSSWYTASSHFCHSSSSLGQRIPCKVNRSEEKIPNWWVLFHQRLMKMRCYSLIWNDFEHQMVQQSELFCNLQRRVIFEGLGLPPHLPDTKEENNNWIITIEWR